MAILVAIFVLDADLHPTTGRPILIVTVRPILIVITPAAAFSAVAIIIGPHSPTATYRPVVPVHLAPHPVPHPLIVVLTHAVALLSSPIPTDLNVLGALPVLLTRLFRLLGRALRLHRGCLGLGGAGRLRLILCE
jgi:hypothetical protein